MKAESIPRQVTLSLIVMILLELTIDNGARKLAASWQDLHDGKNQPSNDLIADATFKITDFEQNEVIVPTWTKLAGLGFTFMDTVFSWLSVNSSPGGDSFRDAVPGGNVADTADRWKWISDRDVTTPLGFSGFSTNGIIAKWEALPDVFQRQLVRNTSRNDCDRFAQASRFTFSILPVLIYDHEDVK